MNDLEQRLAKVRPQRVAVVLADDSTEWLAIPRGRGRWARLAALAVARPWQELRLCDGRGHTLEVLRERECGPDVDAAELDAAELAGGAGAGAELGAVAGPAMVPAGVMVQVAALMQQTMAVTVKTVTASLESTVRTLRTESRAEMTDLLVAHQGMARDAFQIAADARAAESTANERAAAAEAEAAELRAQLANLTQPAPEDSRTDQLVRMLTGGAGGGDPSQGMPKGN